MRDFGSWHDYVMGVSGYVEVLKKAKLTTDFAAVQKAYPRLADLAAWAIDQITQPTKKDRKKKTGQQQADDLNAYWSQLDLLTDEEMRLAELDHLVAILENALHEAGMASVIVSDPDAGGDVTLRHAVNSNNPALMQKVVKAIHDFAAAHRTRDGKVNRCVSIAKEIARRLGA